MASSGPPAVLSRWLGTQEIKPFLKTMVCPQGGIHSPKQAVLQREVWVVHPHGRHICILIYDFINVQCFHCHDWMNIVHSCVILCTILVFSFLFFLSWSFFLYLLFYVFAHYSAPNILTEYKHPALRQNPLVYPSVLFLCLFICSIWSPILGWSRFAYSLSWWSKSSRSLLKGLKVMSTSDPLYVLSPPHNWSFLSQQSLHLRIWKLLFLVSWVTVEQSMPVRFLMTYLTLIFLSGSL